MQYQWYPGHMTKAKRQMQEDIKLVDLVIELVDARIPVSSHNPDIDDLGKNKSRLVLLNKADLADQTGNQAWCEYYKDHGMHAVQLDSRNRAIFIQPYPLFSLCHPRLIACFCTGLPRKRINKCRFTYVWNTCNHSSHRTI